MWAEIFETRRVCCLGETLLLKDDFRDNDPSLRGDEGRGGTALGMGLKVACSGDVVVDNIEGEGVLRDGDFGDSGSGIPLA